VCAQASVLCGSSATVLSSFVIVLPSGGTLVCLHVHEYKNTRSKTDFTIYKNLYMQKVTQYIHVFVIKCLFGSSVFSVTWLYNIRYSVSHIHLKVSETLTRSVLSAIGIETLVTMSLNLEGMLCLAALSPGYP